MTAHYPIDDEGRLELPMITLFMYSGGKDSKFTVKVLKHNMSLIKFGAVLLVTDDINTPDIEGVKIIIVEQATFNDYQKFVVFKLKDYVTTPFVLISHTDGFVLHSNKWQWRFLDYDYIGAPWPSWVHLRGERCGNGGFNLRSKKFIEWSATTSFDPNSILDETKNEDQYLICFKKEERIKLGITIAPLDCAKDFSIEHSISEYPRTYSDCFGFHQPPRFFPEVKKMIDNVIK